MTPLQLAIAEKHRRRAQTQIVAQHRAGAAIELMRQQARVGHMKRRAVAHAGAAPAVLEIFKQQYLEEFKLLERRIAIGQEWGVV
jgi:hypothetical protein